MLLLADTIIETSFSEPLLLGSVKNQQDEEDEQQECDESSDESRKPVTSIISAYRLLTPSVKVYFNISSVLTRYPTLQTHIFSTLLPVNRFN